MRKLIVILIFTAQSAWAINYEVVVVKGKVFTSDESDGPWSSIGDKLYHKAPFYVKTEERSLVKLKSDNENILTIRPNSIIEVKSQHQSKAEVVNVLFGRLKSFVKETSKQKIKQVIETPTTALGVRGTIVEVGFNSENNSAIHITYSGKAYVRKNSALGNNLETFFKDSKIVPQGHMVARSFQFNNQVSKPLRISNLQIKALETNDPFNTELKREVLIDDYNVKSLYPEGVPSAILQNIEESTPHGGFVSLDKAVYIFPPIDAPFDPTTESYIMTESEGGIDSLTGDYLSPPGTELNEDATFSKTNATGKIPNTVNSEEQYIIVTSQNASNYIETQAESFSALDRIVRERTLNINNTRSTPYSKVVIDVTFLD